MTFITDFPIRLYRVAQYAMGMPSARQVKVTVIQIEREFLRVE